VTKRALNILLSCDDGLYAPGTAALAVGLAQLGTVRAAAPGQPSSGAGHAVTLHSPISATPEVLEGCQKAVAVRGTPADSVKLALAELWPGWAHLAVSGINRGPNVGVNVFYSGTVGAAAEAAVMGLSAVAVSLDVGPDYDFAAAARLVAPVLERLAGLLPFPAGVFFNVNLPATGRPVRGVRLTRHGMSGFREFYRPAGTPGPEGTRSWQVDGDFLVNDPDGSFDAAALSAGYVSVTPLQLDLTVDSWRRPAPARRKDIELLLAALADWEPPKEEAPP
jgi:5'-nucleotidase